MANNLRYAVTLKNGKLDQITSAVGASGLFRIYSGTQPTNPDTALSGNTVLAELTLNATFAPFLTSGGTRKVDFTVGTSGADLNLNTVSIVSGAQVSCSSFTITAGN